ncbi:unnamed protein product [Closterium sp. NIES-53]
MPPLPPSPAPPCFPCVEGRQRAAPHFSSFLATSAPLQTLHMDVWGPAHVSGQGRERYILLVVDDYTWYTTVFPLHSKVQVVYVLIPWIRTVRLQLRERFSTDLPVLRLDSDRGGEFSSDLLREFCCGEGILQPFTLRDSPQENGIAERRIDLLMEVARTSMIHERRIDLLMELNLWPHVSLPETSPTLRWTGRLVMRRCSGSGVLVPLSAIRPRTKLSARAIPCVFLGFVSDAPGWEFYHPTSRRLLPSQDVTFDESVPFYRLFPYRSAPLPPPPLFLAPGPPAVDPLPPQGPAPSGVSEVDPPLGAVLGEVVVDSGAARGTASEGAEPRGVEPGGAETGGAEPGGTETGGAKPGGAETGGAEPKGVEPGGAESEGADSCVSGLFGAHFFGVELPELEVLEPLEMEVLEFLLELVFPGGTAATGPGGARTRGAGAGDPTESGAAGAGGSGTSGARVGGAGVGGTGAGGARAGVARAGDPGGTVRPRLYFVSLLQQVLGVPSSTGLSPPLLCPPLDQSQPSLQPSSPLSSPAPYTEQTGGLTERREPVSCPASPVRTGRHVPRPRPPPVLGTHAMTLRPSSVPLRVPLPAPPESSLPKVPDPESDRARATNPTVSRLLATAVTDPSFESAAASALVAELHDFAASSRLDYATALIAEPRLPEEFECLAAAVPRFASIMLAPEGDADAPDIPTPRSYAEAITAPYSYHGQAAMDAEMASWKSTGTYVDKVPPPGANIVNGMWIFRVKRPPGSPPAFKARYVARGFSQRQGVDYF